MTFDYPSQGVLHLTKKDWDIIAKLFDVKDAKGFREKLRIGFTPEDANDLDTKIKMANLRIKNATATIKEHEAKYIDTFDAKPSPQAKRAIQSYAHQKPKGFNETVQRKYKIDFFENDQLVNDQDDSTDPSAKKIKLIVKHIQYSLTAPGTGEGGFTRTITSVKRFT